MQPGEAIVMLTLFVSVGLLIWKWIDTYHKQRMAIIEKGASPSDLFARRRVGDPLTVLKWGLLALSVGLGLLTGIILHEELNVVVDVTPVLGLIMGGVALIIYYGIASVRMKEKGE